MCSSRVLIPSCSPWIAPTIEAHALPIRPRPLAGGAAGCRGADLPRPCDGGRGGGCQRGHPPGGETGRRGGQPSSLHAGQNCVSDCCRPLFPPPRCPAARPLLFALAVPPHPSPPHLSPCLLACYPSAAPRHPSLTPHPLSPRLPSLPPCGLPPPSPPSSPAAGGAHRGGRGGEEGLAARAAAGVHRRGGRAGVRQPEDESG